MDKNSILGLSLIGVILVTFTLLNKPSEAEVKANKIKAAKINQSKAKRFRQTL